MKLIQKIHSIWEGRTFTKKSRLIMSLTALGVLGGFFVAYAIPSLTVVSPTGGFLRGSDNVISWNTTCESDEEINIALEQDGVPVAVIAKRQPCASNFTWDTTLADGGTPVYADGGNYRIAVDNIDSLARGYSGTFVIDNTLPTITSATLISPNGVELWGGATREITWEETEINDLNFGSTPISLAYSINGGNWIDFANNEANDGSYTWALPSVNSEAVKVKITATDLAGNKLSDESDAVFEIDTTAPVVDLTSLAGGEMLKGGLSVDLAWTATDENLDDDYSATLEYFDGSIWHPITLSENDKWTVPSDNTNTAKIKVSVTDKAGNVGSDESGDFTIDSTAPVVTIAIENAFYGPSTYDAGVINGTVSDDAIGSGVDQVDLTISKDDNGVKYWNGSAWQTEKTSIIAIGTTEWTYDIGAGTLTDGVTYRVNASAVDIVGNVTAVGSEVSDSFTYDNIEPVVVINSPTAGLLTNTASQTVSGTFTEINLDSIKVKVNESDEVGATPGVDVDTFSAEVSLVEGANTVTVTATDKAGNHNDATITITLDTVVPEITVNPIVTSDGTPTLTGTIDDINVTVAVSANDVTFTVVQNGTTWTATTTTEFVDGTYSVTATATDNAGNVGTDTANNELVIDTIYPTVSISEPIAKVYKTSETIDIPLKFTATDVNLATCSYQIDGDGTDFPTDCPTSGGSITSGISSLSEGNHTIKVTVVDKAAHSASDTSATFIVDSDDNLSVGEEKDFATISEAISAASSSDTISVDSGTYAENISFGDKTGLKLVGLGTISNPTILKPTSGAAVLTLNADNDNTEIHNFTIDCNTINYGITSTGATGVIIEGNNISGYGKNGIFVDGGTVSIDKSIITGTTSSTFSVDSIYTKGGATLTITDNILSGNIYTPNTTSTSAGISLHHNDTATITGNTIFDNSYGIHIKGAAESEGANPVLVTAKQNEIYGNVVLNFFFEYRGVDPTPNYDASENYWGSPAMGEVSGKIATRAEDVTTNYEKNYISFSPWYLNDDKDANGKLNGKLSNDTTLTVGATGADFTSIQAAIDAAISGATINVAAGSYEESIFIPDTKTGLKIYKVGDTGTATIKAMTGDAITIPIGANDTEIKGFTIDVNGKDYGVKSTGANGVKIESNSISGYAKNGIIVNGGEVTIDGNTITGSLSTTFSVDAIYTSGATLTITNNILSGNKFDSQTSTATGIALHAGDNATITGNTIFGNSFGIQVKGVASGNANPIVSVSRNKIYGNDVLDFFFEDLGVDSNYIVINNWWGNKTKNEIASKIATRASNSVVNMESHIDFSPWYLDEAMTTLSSTDTTDPVVVISTSDTNGIVKAEDSVTITATVTDANGIDGAPQITITNGQVATGDSSTTTLSGLMTYVSGSNWKYDWTVPAGNSSVTITVSAFDAVGRSGTETKTLIIDNTAPTFTIVDGTATGPVQTDTIKISITEANGIAEAKYGFLDSSTLPINSDCSGVTTWTAGTLSGEGVLDFSVAGDLTDYLCAMAEDKAGNIGYLLVGKLNTDNTKPSGYTVAIDQTGINAGNKTALSFTFAGAEVDATYNYTISDEATNSNTKTGTGTIGTLTDQISGIDVSNLIDGTLTLAVTLTDSVGNVGDVATGSNLTVEKDADAPTVSDITSNTADGNYKAEAVISIQVAFDEIVTVTGTPQLELETGEIDQKANYVSGTGTNTLTFTYTVVEGDASSDLDYAGVGALILNDGTITDGSGNAASLVLPAPGVSGSLGANKDIIIDTVAPVIASHDDVSVEATSPQGALVNYTVPTANDNVDGTVIVSCLPESGSFFLIETPTTVKCNATDLAGNAAIETSFTVIVQDTIAPEIVGLTPGNKTSTSTGTPTIGAQFDEAGSGIDVNSIVISITEYPDANYFAEKSATGVSVVPTTPLDNGNYHASVTVSDFAGHSTSASWVFTIDKALSTVSVSVNKTSVPANGVTYAKVTATVLNSGIPAEGATVNFASTIGTFSDITTTNAQGQATASLKSTDIGTTLITATYSSGNGIVQGTNETLKFTSPDTKAPTASSDPLDGATRVATSVSPVITFNEAMDLGTLIDTNIQLRKYSSNAVIPASLEVSAVGTKSVVTINPTNALDRGEKYYFYLAGVTDVMGNEIVAWEKDSHEFTTVADTTTAVINLKAGWNLISLPLVPEDTSIGIIISGADSSKVDLVQYYDAATKEWLSFDPNTTLGDLKTMEDGKGYWINMLEADTLTVYGTATPVAPAAPSLYKIAGNQWNLIGFTSVTSKKVMDYITQMEFGDEILGVDSNGLYVPLTKADLMNPGAGYWFYTPKSTGFDIIPLNN